MRVLAAAAVAVLGAVATIGAGAPPAHADEPAGWLPLFAADFSGGQLPTECRAYEGPQGGEAASYYHPDEVQVDGGLLHLSMRRRDVGGRPYTTGGIGCDQLVQTYGRYEFRAKVPVGAGIDSFVTLWPAEPGHDREASLLEIVAPPGGGRAYLTNQYGGGATQVTVPGDYSGDFHTYTIEWAPGLFRILVDGVPRLTDGHVATRGRWIGFAMSSGDRLAGRPDAATRLPAEFQVDFLRVYAYDSASAPVAGAAPARTSTTAATTVRGIVAVVALVVAVAAAVGAAFFGYARLRARRRLRPAHRA